MDIWQGWMLCTTFDGHEVNLTRQSSLRMERQAQAECTLYQLRDTTTALHGTCDVKY